MNNQLKSYPDGKLKIKLPELRTLYRFDDTSKAEKNRNDFIEDWNGEFNYFMKRYVGRTVQRSVKNPEEISNELIYEAVLYAYNEVLTTYDWAPFWNGSNVLSTLTRVAEHAVSYVARQGYCLNN